MHRGKFALCAALFSVAVMSGQQQFAPYDDPRNLPYSPEVHPDRSVTFRLYAPNAREVLLVGPTIVAALKETKALRKDEKGVFSLTVGPLDPAVYSYCLLYTS